MTDALHFIRDPRSAARRKARLQSPRPLVTRRARLVAARPRCAILGLGALAAVLLCAACCVAQEEVYITGVPDYNWYDGCFGTACGNLAGYWDRHGFPDFYTGPTGGGVAPLNSIGSNYHIAALWASEAGRDGRPWNKPGHVDDYYIDYQRTEPDPYVTEGRTEHTPDCIGDFTGQNQNRWTNQNGECDGNIDGYVFNYFDASGQRRVNFTPSAAAGLPARDLQSGLRAWANYRGYEADVFSQLVDVNSMVPPGSGFTFSDLKAEIQAGYPVLIFLQDPYNTSQPRDLMPRANPDLHGVLAYGYRVDSEGTEQAHLRFSWGIDDTVFRNWEFSSWMPDPKDNLPPRGVIGFRPKPQIRGVTRIDGHLVIRWHGPASEVYDKIAGTYKRVHWYSVERTSSLSQPDFQIVGGPTDGQQLTVPDSRGKTSFFRLRLVPPPE